jgi:hypothetical protein
MMSFVRLRKETFTALWSGWVSSVAPDPCSGYSGSSSFARGGLIPVEQQLAAAQIIISIIPIVGLVMSSVVVFFYLLWNHKRRTLLIKAGQYNPPEFDLLSFSLLAGLLLGAVGLALTIFLALAIGTSFGLLGGIIPLAIGAGLLAYYGIKRGDRSS